MKEYPLFDKIMPTNRRLGFEMEDYWVWCGSVIEGEDGRYHMFASRWSKKYPFFKGYVVSSEIVRASSDTPYGPYKFEEVVLGDRGEEFWDGRMTHNPYILKYGDAYVLFYIGATYKGERPSVASLENGDRTVTDACYSTIRIGVATSKSIFGPWERRDTPVFDINPDSWDSSVVTNPSPCILPDGKILLYYRSNAFGGLRIGVARAENLDSPFIRLTDEPIFGNEPGKTVEDTFVWWNGENIELIAKDMNGDICGEKWGGIHMVSKDGINFEPAKERKSYSRTVRFADGTEEVAFHLERPNMMIKDGKPFMMCFAYATASEEYIKNINNLHATIDDPDDDFAGMEMSKTLIIPLETE